MRILPSLAGTILALAALAGCGGAKQDDAGTVPLSFPGGKTIRVEVMQSALDMARGMMFRERMEPDRGMLFVHDRPGVQKYWMYQVKIPLDLVYINPDRTVVDIAANTPPCPPEKKATQCPTYGKVDNVKYVLELAGGDAARYNLKIGDVLAF